ncbi:MAG: anhydro-N-acetylmuramic acid kinase [Parvularculales bacterium]
MNNRSPDNRFLISPEVLSSVLRPPLAGQMTALGLMSGTSLDGIDVALLTTDGGRILHHGPAMMVSYEEEKRALLQAALEAATHWSPETPLPETLVEAERVITHAHKCAVDEFIETHGISRETIDLIGFHGQTVLHQPGRQRTVQLGQGDRLACETGIDVINDFRSADVAVGGQGAPLASLYHMAMAVSMDMETPLAVVNIGGIANVTFIDIRNPSEAYLLACDTGPGNGLLNDWIGRHLGLPHDQEGRLALAGTVDELALARFMALDFFSEVPPKSLDRLHFDLGAVGHLNVADGAATLTAFTATAIARVVEHLPEAPVRWIICGGGRHNPALMAALSRCLSGTVEPAEAIGWRGDSLEAEAFAWLAVRSAQGLALSVPGTTGAPQPVCGGQRHLAKGNS